MAAIVAERDQVTADRDRLASEREHYRDLYQRALEQCRKLELGLWGSKAERLPAQEAQLAMAVLATVLAAQPAAESAEPELIVEPPSTVEPSR